MYYANHYGSIHRSHMSLVAFMQAGNASVYAGSWRHPATEHRFLDASYYADLGRLLERGCFDLMFLTIGWPCPASTVARSPRPCATAPARSSST